PIYGSWDFDTEWFTTDRYPILQFSAKTIEAESGNNGTITPSGTIYVAAGADKTFVITPDSGFRVSKMSIDGKSTKVTQTYKFNRVSQNHQISVSFTKVSNLSGSFTLPTPETPKDDSPQTPDTPQPPDTPQLGSYPTQPIRLGADNDPDQVKLLQEFLNLFENAGLEVTGIFTKEDEAALIRWQEKYASDVLSPWGLTQGTGFLYTTSLSKMRELFLERYPEAQPTYIFSRDLRMSMTGDDVKLLQQFLNSQGFTLTQQGAGSPGNETTFFGRLTYNALIRFQEAYSDDILRPIGLTSGTGIFSQYSRKKAEELSGMQGFGGL
ncbi:MAG: peptidoglycan-binding domain-containing protein, partial [Minisyncoccales bacterium]